MKKIAIEEHFTTEAYLDYLRSRKDCPRLATVEDEKRGRVERLYRTPSRSQLVPPQQTAKLLDVGAGRLAEMDKAGIDMQVMMLAGPCVEELGVLDGAAWAKNVNDELAAAVKKHPDRLAGFASLAYGDPRGAADELERAVKKLGLKGAKLNSHVGGRYLDDKKYWVLFEAAEKLGAPIYIHPKAPPQGMLDLVEDYPALTGAMWAFAADTSLHAMRLICSGLFDAFPGLKIILGHLGEGIPFWQWRIDNRWTRGSRNTPKRKPSEYFHRNFWVTTSGMFGEQAFSCVYATLGAERILFAVDYPYESNEEGARFIENVPICEADKERICHANAEKLLAL